MKKYLTLILLLFTALPQVWGQGGATFTYDTNGTNITLCTKADVNNNVIVPVMNGDIKIVSIKGLLSKDGEPVNNIYIPKDIKITGTLVYGKGNLFQSAAIYNNMNTQPFSLVSASETTKEIFVINTNNKTIESTDLAGHSNLILNVGDASILFQDESNVVIRVFHVDANQYERKKFGKEKFEKLLWAIDQHLKHENPDLTISDIAKIDLSNLNIANDKFTFEDENYNPASALNIGAEVILPGTDKKYTNVSEPSQTFADKVDFYAPITSYTTEVHYARSNTKEWNSVCLPFDISNADFAAYADTKIYTFTKADQESVTIEKLADGVTLAAGTPCFIYSGAESWDLILANREIKKDVKAGTVEHDGWRLRGAFQNGNIGAGKYKLAGDGQELGQTRDQGKVTAFRCYFEPTSPNAAPARMTVNIDEAAAITTLQEENNAQPSVSYDLMGRRCQQGKGFQLHKNKVIIIK